MRRPEIQAGKSPVRVANQQPELLFLVFDVHLSLGFHLDDMHHRTSLHGTQVNAGLAIFLRENCA